MAIAVTNVSPGARGSSVSTLNDTLTISGERRWCWGVVCIQSNAADITSLVLDPAGSNEAFTEIAELTQGNATVGWFELTAPTTGSGLTVTATTGSAHNISMGAVQLTDVDQTTPHQGLTTAAASVAPAAVTLADASGALTLDGMGAQTARPATANTGQTEQVNTSDAATTPDVGISSEAGATEMQWNFTGGGQFNAYIGALSVNEDVGGGAPAPIPPLITAPIRGY